MSFPGGTAGKNLPVSAGDTRDAGRIPGLGRSLGGGNGNPLQYSCLENSSDREARWAAVHGIAKSHTRLGMYTWPSMAWNPDHQVFDTSNLNIYHWYAT